MIRFADSTRCPDCGSPLPARPVRCQSCGLPLQGELPEQLFATLHQADSILARLRQSAAFAAAAPAHASTAGLGSVPANPGIPSYPTYPSYPVSPPQQKSAQQQTSNQSSNSGLSSATVPKILLGLGALCLVVAALIFLAVTWSALGVAGRTTILLVLTAAAFAGAEAFARRSLPAATESFTVIGLAFAGLSLAGAANAGWLPPMSGPWFTAVLGALFAALGLATAEAARRAPGRVMYSGEFALGLGIALAAVGSAVALPRHIELVLVITVIVCAGIAALGLRALDEIRRVSFLTLAAISWFFLAINGLTRATQHASLDGLWADGHVWPLLAAAALAASPVAVRQVSHAARVGGATVAATLAWVALWLPIVAIDSPTTAVATTLAPLLLASAATYLAPARWRIVAAVPLGLSVTVPAGALVSLCVLAASRFEPAVPWTATFGALLPAADAPISALLMVPLALALLVGAAAFTRLGTDPLPLLARHAVPITAVLALIATATIAHAPAPIAVIVGLTLLIGGGVAAWSLLSGRVTWVALAAVVLTMALWPAATGDWFTAITFTAIAVLAATLALGSRHSKELRATGDAVLPPALAAALWVYCAIAGLSPGASALIVLATLGALAILRPRIAGEIATAGTAFLTIAIAAAVTTATDEQSALTWLAVNLTVVGALVGIHSLLTPGRLHLRWLAAAILVLASWVRLGQIGVTTPEAYTLPAAVVLLAAGLLALRRQRSESTHRALAAGLLLALLPSLVWALVEPISMRGLLLGLACAALVLGGALASWSAPLIYGASAGAILALRVASPWAAQINPWIVTGVLGVILTATGITWESRLQELRRSRKYLARLR